MRRIQGRWADVQSGHYVEDLTGKLWKVTYWDHIAARLLDGDGVTTAVRPPPYSPVTYCVRTVSDAVRAIRETFPGAEIVHDTKGEA